MALPKPVPGLVLRYSYLWHSEHLRGQEEGSKDRPCAIVMVVNDEDGELIVTVLPITHSSPSPDLSAVEIPAATKQRLNLDSQRSWVVLSEANRFKWPGPDIRPASQGNLSEMAYGLLPRTFYNTLRDKFDALITARLGNVVRRTE